MTELKKFTLSAKTGKGNSLSPETAERRRVKELRKQLLKQQSETVPAAKTVPQKKKEDR